jgi:hypothetical protein
MQPWEHFCRSVATTETQKERLWFHATIPDPRGGANSIFFETLAHRYSGRAATPYHHLLDSAPYRHQPILLTRHNNPITPPSRLMVTVTLHILTSDQRIYRSQHQSLPPASSKKEWHVHHGSGPTKWIL